MKRTEGIGRDAHASLERGPQRRNIREKREQKRGSQGHGWGGVGKRGVGRVKTAAPGGPRTSPGPSALASWNVLPQNGPTSLSSESGSPGRPR